MKDGAIAGMEHIPYREGQRMAADTLVAVLLNGGIELVLQPQTEGVAAYQRERFPQSMPLSATALR